MYYNILSHYCSPATVDGRVTGERDRVSLTKNILRWWLTESSRSGTYRCSNSETTWRGRILFRSLFDGGVWGAGHRKRRRRYVRYRRVHRPVVLDDRRVHRPVVLHYRSNGSGLIFGARRLRGRPRRRIRLHSRVLHFGPFVEQLEWTEYRRDDRFSLARQQMLVSGDQSVVDARQADRFQRHLCDCDLGGVLPYLNIHNCIRAVLNVDRKLFG
ncbi:hypothetical protein AGLY_003651 [Aphis glycines]|uniref:Uncharacterized protein n=1 Tax=Aphis glycines TaxID=307491 RepID=A0A6G0U155_APHGL|nr:hypothetical protein AGLY_003651 [Aphis glycines]